MFYGIGGAKFSKILAKVWKGCSQASGHPTQDTNHPPVNPKALDEALRIIVEHLGRTIYSGGLANLLAQNLDIVNAGQRPEPRHFH
jgi:hypothetical protein